MEAQMIKSIVAFFVVFFSLVAVAGTAQAFYVLEGGLSNPDGGITIKSPGGDGSVKLVEDTNVYFTNIDNTKMDHTRFNAGVVEHNNPLFWSHGTVVSGTHFNMYNTIQEVMADIDVVKFLPAGTLLDMWFNVFNFESGSGSGTRLGSGASDREWIINPIGSNLHNTLVYQGETVWEYWISNKPIPVAGEVPEPTTLLLLAISLLGLCFVSKRQAVSVNV